MNEPITAFVGLDAHAESTAIAVAQLGRAPPRFVGTVGAKFTELSKALGKLGKPSCLMIVYEAGPCGYALAPELTGAGYRCEVVAPSKVPRRAGERVKTDRRDALMLASLARAGELTAVSVPDERDEAMPCGPGTKPANNSKHCCCVRDAVIRVRAPGRRLTSATSPRCPSHTAPRTLRSWSIGKRSARARPECSA
jgi:hypothetical protein